MKSTDEILSGLNDAQRRAAGLVRGPVCILAGAGTGKTTTITRRIALQVASGSFQPGQILAVTFTDKAAAEMRRRLGDLGAAGVRARTFHSAALAQLRALSARPPGDVLPGKAAAIRQLANRLPRPHRFAAAADLAAEIEWAKNGRIYPDAYLEAAAGRATPIPAELMARLYRGYEREKSARGLIDFEDVLELTIAMFDDDEVAAARVRERYRAFTVDEFQDVNRLQHDLLMRWLGGRDDVCAVGDDYQSIYGFTGATPDYLLALPDAFANTAVVRLETNYRSTPEILSFANRLVPHLGGARKSLAAVTPHGPEPVARAFFDDDAETSAVVEHVLELARAGVAYEEVAILYRTNARSQEYEAALAAAGIPFQVRDGAFLTRAAARYVARTFERSATTAVAAEVRAAALKQGWRELGAEELGEREQTRQQDLARLVELAAEFDDGTRTGADFVADVRARFSPDGDGHGVNLLTFHRAKGLEFEAVLVPRLNEGELPYRRARSDAAVAEERRLLYVALTRCRSRLFLSWLLGSKRSGSRFLAELGIGAAASRRPGSGRRERSASPATQALRAWRRDRSHAAGVPAYVILHDSTLEEIARRMPATTDELAGVPGIGPMRMSGYGDEILAVLRSATTP